MHGNASPFPHWSNSSVSILQRETSPLKVIINILQTYKFCLFYVAINVFRKETLILQTSHSSQKEKKITNITDVISLIFPLFLNAPTCPKGCHLYI